MAKSSRASTVKANNRNLKKNVFGPVESARTERLSAKLIELAAQPKPQKEADIEMNADDADSVNAEESSGKKAEATEGLNMDVDVASIKKSSKRSSGRIQKKKTSKIVFPKYKDRKSKKKA